MTVGSGELLFEALDAGVVGGDGLLGVLIF